MVIDRALAATFISTYTKLMIEVCPKARSRCKRSVLEVLAEGRSKCLADHELLETARRQLRSRGETVDADAFEALASMQLKKWVYLRDTKTYSVFLDPSGDAAYAVLGLTEPIRNIIGGSGVMVETAVVRYRGRFVCDGLIAGMVLWIGPNYRRSYSALLRKLKADGEFHTKYEP